MKTIPNELTANFDDISCRKKIIEQYGDSTTMYSGTNQNGEDVYVSISRTGIGTKTNQSNARVRVNYYDHEGYDAGESYDGRWHSCT